MTVGDDGNWSATFDSTEMPDDGVYAAEVTVTDPQGNIFDLAGPNVDIDTTPPDLAITGGTESTGDLVNADLREDGATISGTR